MWISSLPTNITNLRGGMFKCFTRGLTPLSDRWLNASPMYVESESTLAQFGKDTSFHHFSMFFPRWLWKSCCFTKRNGYGYPFSAVCESLCEIYFILKYPLLRISWADALFPGWQKSFFLMQSFCSLNPAETSPSPPDCEPVVTCPIEKARGRHVSYGRALQRVHG